MLMKSGVGALESISQETMHSPICFLGRMLEGDNFFARKVVKMKECDDVFNCTTLI